MADPECPRLANVVIERQYTTAAAKRKATQPFITGWELLEPGGEDLEYF